MPDIKILGKTEEPLLKRKLVEFEVSHGASPTPKRKETKSKLAVLLGTEEPLVVIDNFKTTYGLNIAKGTAFVYESEDALVSAEGKVKASKEKNGKHKKNAPGSAPSQ